MRELPRTVAAGTLGGLGNVVWGLGKILKIWPFRDSSTREFWGTEEGALGEIAGGEDDELVVCVIENLDKPYGGPFCANENGSGCNEHTNRAVTPSDRSNAQKSCAPKSREPSSFCEVSMKSDLVMGGSPSP